MVVSKYARCRSSQAWGGEPLPLSQCGCQLHRRAGRLFQHHGFQRLEVPAAHMAGKPGDRGVGDLQPLGQLPDGGEQEGVCVGVDIIQDLLLRPGQFPGRGGMAQLPSKALILSKLFAACCGAAHWRPAGGRPDTQGKRAAIRGCNPPSGLFYQQAPGCVVPGLERELHITIQTAAGHPAQVQAGAAGAADILAGIVQGAHLPESGVRQFPSARDCPHREEAVFQPIRTAYTDGAAIAEGALPRRAVKHSPL